MKKMSKQVSLRQFCELLLVIKPMCKNIEWIKSSDRRVVMQITAKNGDVIKVRINIKGPEDLRSMDKYDPFDSKFYSKDSRYRVDLENILRRSENEAIG